LPDERIERSAWSSRLAGSEVHFAGPRFKSVGLPSDPFVTKRELPFDKRSNLGEPISTSRLLARFRQIASEIRPDLIHAHDLFAGRLAAKVGIPFVYDDHEYWSKAVVADSDPIDPTSIYKRLLWSSWEDTVLDKAQAVITVGSSIAEEHRKKNNRVFIVPNFPRVVEVKDLPAPESMGPGIVSAYVGSCTPPFISFRDTTGLTDLFLAGSIGVLKVIGDERLRSGPHVLSLGRLSHASMMREIGTCHLGLIPWKKHWFHHYCNPNKAYEYAHAGCLVIVTRSLSEVRDTLLEHCFTFDGYEEMSSIIVELGSDQDELVRRRKNIQAFARDHLVWDRFDATVNEAYRV
jgi:hypothetical protein